VLFADCYGVGFGGYYAHVVTRAGFANGVEHLMDDDKASNISRCLKGGEDHSEHESRAIIQQTAIHSQNARWRFLISGHRHSVYIGPERDGEAVKRMANYELIFQYTI